MLNRQQVVDGWSRYGDVPDRAHSGIHKEHHPGRERQHLKTEPGSHRIFTLLLPLFYLQVLITIGFLKLQVSQSLIAPAEPLSPFSVITAVSTGTHQAFTEMDKNDS